MTLFTSTKIFLDSETVAEQLRSGRQAKGLKLEEVAKKLNISQKYLEALEKNELEKIPRGVYGKNFLKDYARFLGLDWRELLKIFEKEKTVQREEERGLFSAQIAKKRHFWATPKVAKNILIAAIVSVCLFYLGYRLNKIISPPRLVVSSPAENLTTDQKTIEVAGFAEKEAQIAINGEQVLSDPEGRFAKNLDLKNGLNTIKITAKKKYGRENTIIRQVLVK